MWVTGRRCIKESKEKGEKGEKMFILNLENMLYIALLIGGVLAGGFIAFKAATKTALIDLKNETINAYQQRLEAVEGRINELEKENLRNKNIIETIQSALKQKGIIVTIDGDLVTIQADGATSSSMRRRPGQQKQKPDEEKKI